MSKTKTSRKNQFIVLILMILSLETIYVLPYIRYTFFEPLQQAMGLVGEAEKFGNTMSIYGLFNVIFYLPGGIIADRFSPKKLLVFSMISSGALGLWLSTWPSYEIILVIHALWAFTTVLTYWSASIKVVNLIAGSDEQGGMYSALEGGRGVVTLALNAVWIAAFSYFAKKIVDTTEGNIKGITFLVIVVSVIMILVGLLMQFLFPKMEAEGVSNTNMKESIRAILGTFKLPITWVLIVMIFVSSTANAVAAYYAPYLQAFAGLTVVATGTFQAVRAQGSRLAASAVFGFASTRMKRSTFMLIVGCVIALVGSLALVGVAPSNSTLILMMIIMVVISFASYGNRSLYWAIIDEAGTPKMMVGSVVGAASLLGYLPDTFIHTLFGNWLDNLEPLVAYKRIFTFLLIVAAVGIVVAIFGEKIVVKYKKSLPAKEETAAE